MKSREATLIPVRTAATILDEIEKVYDQIAGRAYEIFLKRGGVGTLDLDDWFAAEQLALFKPPVSVEETDRRIVITIRIGRVSPLDVRLSVASDAMVIQADDNTSAKKIFRTVEFPRRIDVGKVEARYANGQLVVTAAAPPLATPLASPVLAAGTT
jgi:HSP20 family molecular chaperone IbpA